MGFTIKLDVFDGEVVVPDPFTGANWISYMTAFREREESDDKWLRMYRGAVAVIERGHVVIDGVRYDLKQAGVDTTPLTVIWVVGPVVDAFIASKFSLPKASSSEQSPSPTAAETEPTSPTNSG
jgi:hypothetical protein